MKDGTVTVLRLLALVSGLGLAACAIFADGMGMGASEGLARFQAISAALAAILLTAAMLGRHFPGLYRGLGLIVISLVILACAVEVLSFGAAGLLGSRGLLVSGGSSRSSGSIVVGLQEGLVYEPFVAWTIDPWADFPYMTMEAGCRAVPGASQDSTAYTVLVYGSGTVLGPLVGDSATIPCFLQQEISGRVQRPVRVMNMARPGWVSTQAVTDLFLRLRDGGRPDLVIFLGGMEDVVAAWQSGRAGAHLDLQAMGAPFSPGSSPGADPCGAVLRSTSTWRLASGLFSPEEEQEPVMTYEELGISTQRLAREVVAAFEGNARMASDLGRLYGFEARFYWQPCVWRGAKVLTAGEVLFHDAGVELDQALMDLIDASYAIADSASSATGRFASLEGVFDDTAETVYIDHDGTSLNAEGNSTIAREVAGG